MVNTVKSKEEFNCVVEYSNVVMQLTSTALYHYLKQINNNLSQMDICVGYSGGIDSSVLLHLTAQLRASALISNLRAIHVNHNLSPAAQSWQEHCQHICNELDVPLQLFNIHVQKQPRESLEANARELRYAEFKRSMHKNSLLLLAHHQDDQAETLLLQLLRGSGIKGLAAMPAYRKFGLGYIGRPLLSFSRAEIIHYAHSNGLQIIEDESNTNLQFDRNYLRHKIIPAIRSRWPTYQQTFARSAMHCAVANDICTEVANIDMQQCVGTDKDRLMLTELCKLPLVRCAQVIRYFLQSKNLSVPTYNQLQQFITQLVNMKKDSQPILQFAGVELRCFQGFLYAFKRLPLIAQNFEVVWDLHEDLELPGGLGRLRCLCLPEEPMSLVVRFRRSGERFHPQGRCGSHPLKKLFQEWQVPPWQRHRIPLVYAAEQLIWVAGYAFAKNVQNQLLSGIIWERNDNP